MQQRRLRLGDILDDYCPRERRITNHAVVAMIDDEVKQTRCTTCDSDHEYRQARIPPPRRKKETLTPPTATNMADHETQEHEIVEEAPLVPEGPSEPASAEAQAESVDAAPAGETGAAGEEPREEQRGEDEGPVHRRLIRATLPRPEGQAPERKIPEFTVRQPGGHGNQRHGRGRRAARGPQGGSFSGPMRFGSGSHQSSPPGRQRQNSNNRPGPSGNQRGGGRPQGQQRGSGRKRGR
jgi:hypothetical protein